MSSHRQIAERCYSLPTSTTLLTFIGLHHGHPAVQRLLEVQYEYSCPANSPPRLASTTPSSAVSTLTCALLNISALRGRFISTASASRSCFSILLLDLGLLPFAVPILCGRVRVRVHDWDEGTLSARDDGRGNIAQHNKWCYGRTRTAPLRDKAPRRAFESLLHGWSARCWYDHEVKQHG